MKEMLSEKNLWDIFEDSVKEYKDKIAIKYLGKEYTYEEYYNDICNISFKIERETSVNEKSIIIIYSENSYLFACYVMACVRLGVRVVPLNTKMDRRDYDRIIRETGTKCIYTDDEIMLSKDNSRLLEKSDYNYTSTCSENKRNTDVQIILFSSGSTGEIKGIECTQSAIMAATYSINEVIGNNANDNILCILDFSFDYGLYQLFLAYEVGATVTIMSSKENVLRIPEFIYKNGVTGFPATPFLLKLLKDSQKADSVKLSSLRYITSTGDHLCHELIDYYRKLLPGVSIYPMYGLTECKRVSILKPEDYENHKNSVGKPISCCSVKIIKEDGKKAENGEAGELVVIGSNVMKGYYLDESLTRDKFVKGVNGQIELHTGDIFTMDDEGFLYYIGRTQNYIKIRGKRVSPLSIEQQILDKCEEIEDCIVVPLREVDKEDVIFCFFKIKDKCLSEKVAEYISKQLTHLYIPKFYYEYHGLFPHNSNGKVDRKKMVGLAKELFIKGECIEQNKKIY